MNLSPTFLAGLLVVAMASPAAAQAGIEIRLGPAVSGMELSSWFVPKPDSFNIVNLDSVQADVLIDLPDAAAFDWIGNPRFELGGLVNLAGRESTVHAGLNWHVPLFTTPVFFELGVGGGVHNGVASGAVAPMRNLGCNWGFHYSYTIGANVSERLTVAGKFQHISHAGVCGPDNQGLNSFGLSAGYKF